jgi:DNA (cytosine-5)-methyltransferase 1
MIHKNVENVQKSFFENKENWETRKLLKPKSTIRVASLFSGIGAFEQALKILGLKSKIVLACDNDQFVKKSFFANYEIEEKNWFDDVQKINGTKFKNKVDLLVGGAPCQSFSMVGKRLGLKDTRGNLTLHFIKKINEIKPKVFIFENVRALLSVDNGEAWKIIYNKFRQTGYNFYYDKLNAKNFGIPQNRERLFVVGFKNKQNFLFPQQIKLKNSMQDFLEGQFDKKFYLPPKGVAFVTKNKNLKKRYTQVNGKIALCQKRNQQFNWHGDFVQVKKSNIKKYILSDKVKKYVLSSGTKGFYSKPEIDLEIARPLISTMHKMHRSGVDNYISLKKGKIRKLTPRECLRLMGFPDTFKQVVSDTQLYRQTGNSIVVNIIIALLKEMDISKFGTK